MSTLGMRSSLFASSIIEKYTTVFPSQVESPSLVFLQSQETEQQQGVFANVLLDMSVLLQYISNNQEQVWIGNPRIFLENILQNFSYYQNLINNSTSFSRDVQPNNKTVNHTVYQLQKQFHTLRQQLENVTLQSNSTYHHTITEKIKNILQQYPKQNPTSVLTTNTVNNKEIQKNIQTSPVYFLKDTHKSPSMGRIITKQTNFFHQLLPYVALTRIENCQEQNFTLTDAILYREQVHRKITTAANTEAAVWRFGFDRFYPPEPRYNFRYTPQLEQKEIYFFQEQQKIPNTNSSISNFWVKLENNAEIPYNSQEVLQRGTSQRQSSGEIGQGAVVREVVKGNSVVAGNGAGERKPLVWNRISVQQQAMNIWQQSHWTRENLFQPLTIQQIQQNRDRTIFQQQAAKEKASLPINSQRGDGWQRELLQRVEEKSYQENNSFLLQQEWLQREIHKQSTINSKETTIIANGDRQRPQDSKEALQSRTSPRQSSGEIGQGAVVREVVKGNPVVAENGVGERKPLVWKHVSVQQQAMNIWQQSHWISENLFQPLTIQQIQQNRDRTIFQRQTAKERVALPINSQRGDGWQRELLQRVEEKSYQENNSFLLQQEWLQREIHKQSTINSKETAIIANGDRQRPQDSKEAFQSRTSPRQSSGEIGQGAVVREVAKGNPVVAGNGAGERKPLIWKHVSVQQQAMNIWQQSHWIRENLFQPLTIQRIQQNRDRTIFQQQTAKKRAALPINSQRAEIWHRELLQRVEEKSYQENNSFLLQQEWLQREIHKQSTIKSKETTIIANGDRQRPQDSQEALQSRTSPRQSSGEIGQGAVVREVVKGNPVVAENGVGERKPLVWKHVSVQQQAMNIWQQSHWIRENLFQPLTIQQIQQNRDRTIFQQQIAKEKAASPINSQRGDSWQRELLQRVEEKVCDDKTFVLQKFLSNDQTITNNLWLHPKAEKKQQILQSNGKPLPQQNNPIQSILVSKNFESIQHRFYPDKKQPQQSVSSSTMRTEVPSVVLQKQNDRTAMLPTSNFLPSNLHRNQPPKAEGFAVASVPISQRLPDNVQKKVQENRTIKPYSSLVEGRKQNVAKPVQKVNPVHHGQQTENLVLTKQTFLETQQQWNKFFVALEKSGTSFVGKGIQELWSRKEFHHTRRVLQENPSLRQKEPNTSQTLSTAIIHQIEKIQPVFTKTGFLPTEKENMQLNKHQQNTFSYTNTYVNRSDLAYRRPAQKEDTPPQQPVTEAQTQLRYIKKVQNQQAQDLEQQTGALKKLERQLKQQEEQITQLLRKNSVPRETVPTAHQLADQVMKEIQRQMRMERQRRGG